MSNWKVGQEVIVARAWYNREPTIVQTVITRIGRKFGYIKSDRNWNEPPYPPGEYAIVEVFGHTTMVGRIAEIERFGTKMLAIEPLFAGNLLDPILQGGASIYRLTMCSAETAFREQPTKSWQLPGAVQKIVPSALLEAPEARAARWDSEDRDEPDTDDADDRPF